MIDQYADTLTRAKLYVLISAMETDLRDILRRYVLPYLEEEQAFGQRYALLRERAARDAGFTGGSLSLLDHADFSDAFELINRHADPWIPDEIAHAVRELTPRLGTTVSQRNRVMHSKPLAPDDLEQVLQLCADAAARLPLPAVGDLLRRLRDDPSWDPVMPQSGPAPSAILHNLPLPDFDETGLIGRGDENRDLLERLMHGRDQMLTVVAEGGMGKTALVVKTLYDLVDEPACPYDVLLWASLKTERLTGEGVQAIRDAALDVVGVTHQLAGAIDESFSGSAQDLADVLRDTETLVVIDNVETTDGEEIVRFYDAMPHNCRFLLTSRVGLGQIERRLPLDPLPAKAGTHMLRMLAKRRGVDPLARTPQKALEEQVARLRATPLAIRWYVESVAAGREPSATLGNQAELLRFCLETIYEDLSELARHCLSVLYVAGSPLDAAHLAHVTEAPPDDLTRAVQDLQRRSLVEALHGGEDGLHRRYRPSAATAQYLSSVDRPSGDVLKTAREKLAELRRSEEQRREASFFDPYFVNAQGEQHIAVAHLLRTAALTDRRDPAGSRNKLDQALALAPEWHETARIEALIHSHAERYEAAAEAYERALDLSVDERDRGRVAYFFSILLSNHLRDTQRGTEMAEIAHKTLAAPATACRLAQCLLYNRQFDRAEQLLRPVLSAGDSQTALVARTQLLSLTKRRIERMRREGAPGEAVQTGVRALREAAAYVDSGVVADQRLRNMCLNLSVEILNAALEYEEIDALESDLTVVARYGHSHADELLLSVHRLAWSNASRRLLRRRDCPHAVTSWLAEIEARVEASEGGKPLRGAVERFEAARGFGFLKVADTDTRLFFHRNDLRDGNDLIFMVEGAEVSFAAHRAEKGPRAEGIRVELDHHAQEEFLRRRTIVVKVIQDVHLFARDELTNATVYVDRRAVHASMWRRLSPGSRLVCDLRLDSRNPAAVYGTVTDARVPRRAAS